MIKYLVCTKGFYEVEKYSSKAWVCVMTPTPEEQIFLTEEFGVPEPFLKDIEDNEERPRVEYEDGWRMIIIRVPFKSLEQENLYTTVPLGILTSGEKFITVCHSEVEMVEDFIKYTRRKNFEEKNAADLTLHLQLSAAVWFLKYLKMINYEIKDAEEQLQTSVRNEELLELMRLEKTLVYFITSIRGNEILLQKFQSILKLRRAKYDDDLFEDVEIEMQQARTVANVYSEVLAGMMDAFAAIINNNLNVVMKRLTSISIILMLPTLIASYYGMNLEEGTTIYNPSFYIVIVATLLLASLIVMFFRKKRWL
ncbi:MAG: magnesium transporter CorA family protein [Bacteroidetes bacterium]|nr:magnesium transporter CorA family protein [Bacteroidota bacterium]MCL2303095.1 magnesium transporter CorA family protein [Lentimicrobiaceae bacterium]